MDFSQVLESLDNLIKKRVEEAEYTRLLTAVVQDIENSENNTYKVSYDNGKTITIAVSIASNGNEIQYQKGDSVQLLQYNGIGNTNTTLYILGKSADFTEQNLADLEDYFTSITSYTINTFTQSKTFLLKDGSSVVENIKKYGSFILKAKFTVDNSNKVYNYGIKITLNFTNDIKPIEYMFDTYQMVGQPWLYQNMEQIYRQKIDEFYLPYLNSIILTKFVDEGHSITIYDMEISSAILNVSNDYTAMFKGSRESVDFITDNQENKASTTLQTIFYKNNQTFASSICKYYWFIKDDSIEIGSDYYHKYGGVGWKCLNSYETIEYLNEIPQKIFNNNIGDTLIVDQNNAPHYHNYYKCVVEYGLRIAATQEREILNLDKTNINFTLTTENNTITKLDDNTILNLTLNINGDLSILKKIGWYYQRDDQNKQNLIKIENITDNTKRQYILNVSGIKEILGKNYTVFTCVLLGDSNVTLGQCHITITRDLNGELTEEIWYHDNRNSVEPPAEVNTTDGTWTKEIPEKVGERYVFAASRLVSATYQGPFGDIYCYSARGTGAAAAQLTEFNRLTNNGKDQGLYYSQDTKNKLYINADYINTGTLRVGDVGSEKFYASINSKDIEIGGFTVDNKSLISKDGAIGFSQDTNNWVLWTGATDQDQATAPFRVDKYGALYSTKGEIGGFTIGTTSLDWINPENNAEQVHLGQNGLILGNNNFKIDQQGNITWGKNDPVSYDRILNNIKEKDDGIYAIKNDKDERVSIGINASAINTGALNIKQSNNIIFHAEATAEATNPFYINTPNFKLNVNNDGNVTVNGAITATTGKIGNWIISEIEDNKGALRSEDNNFFIDPAKKILRIGNAASTYAELTSNSGGKLQFINGTNATTLWLNSFEMNNGTERSLSFGIENLIGGSTQTYLRFDPGFALVVSDGTSTHKVELNAYSEALKSGLTLSADNITLIAKTSGALTGNWDLPTDSDRTLKNSIELLGNKYSILFDSLHPVRYKYNNGTSGRYHTGFIAQELKDAIDNAGLTTMDFAGYVEDDGICRIRYSELIALCVQEIQLLKKEIKEIKGEI